MANQLVNVDHLAEAIMQDLEIYAQNTVRDVEYAVNKVAKLAREELEQTSPVGLTEGYSKSWAVRRHPYAGMHYHSKVVYSKWPQHGKTHLLERGHEAPDGSFVAARPHIQRVEEKAQRWMPELLAKRLNDRR